MDTEQINDNYYRAGYFQGHSDCLEKVQEMMDEEKKLLEDMIKLVIDEHFGTWKKDFEKVRIKFLEAALESKKKLPDTNGQE